MTAIIIDGKLLAKKIKNDIKYKLQFLDPVPNLAVIIIGNHLPSMIYVRNKQKACEEVGIKFHLHKLPEDIEELSVLKLIDQLNRDQNINGILVQLPLSPHLSIEKIINNISPDKDVDGFNFVNVGKLSLGLASFVPGTAIACLKLVKSVETNLTGKKVLIIGRSNIVGKPTAQIFLQENTTITHAHSYSRNLEEECGNHDIVIAAIGKPNYIKANWLKKDSIIIDVGINRLVKSGSISLTGDVEFEKSLEKVRAITPVPGGVGPMTIASLLENSLKAFLQQNNLA